MLICSRRILVHPLECDMGTASLVLVGLAMSHRSIHLFTRTTTGSALHNTYSTNNVATG